MVNEKMCQAFFRMKGWQDMELIGVCDLGTMFQGENEDGNPILVACNDEKARHSDEFCLDIFENFATRRVFDTGSTKIKPVEFKVVSFLKIEGTEKQYLMRVVEFG